MSVGGGADDLGLVRHQLEAPGDASPSPGPGSVMQAGAPGEACSKELSSGSMSSQPASLRVLGRGGAAENSGFMNGLASCAGDGRGRGDPALGRGGRRARARRASRGPARGRPCAASPASCPGAGGDLGVLVEQLEERGVAGGDAGQDRGDAVQPLELGVAARLGERLVGPAPAPARVARAGRSPGTSPGPSRSPGLVPRHPRPGVPLARARGRCPPGRDDGASGPPCLARSLAAVALPPCRPCLGRPVARLARPGCRAGPSGPISVASGHTCSFRRADRPRPPRGRCRGHPGGDRDAR